MAINTHPGKNIDGGWIIYRNCDNAFRATLTNASTGAAIDTSNVVFSMEFYTDGGTSVKLTLTEADGDITNDDAGIIDFTLTQEDIVSLPRDRYFFVIKYSVSGGDVKPLAQAFTEITSQTNPGTTTTSVTFPATLSSTAVNMAVTLAGGASTAEDVTFTPAGNIAATDVQAAIEELDTDLTAHEADTVNPHAVTKTQVGLGSVDNTSDANKPVSTAQQAALDLKADDDEVWKTSGTTDLDGNATINVGGSTLSIWLGDPLSNVIQYQSTGQVSFGSNDDLTAIAPDGDIESIYQTASSKSRWRLDASSGTQSIPDGQHIILHGGDGRSADDGNGGNVVLDVGNGGGAGVDGKILVGAFDDNGASPSLTNITISTNAAGGEANVDMTLEAKGTGAVKAATAAQGTNTTQVATTAFTIAEIAARVFGLQDLYIGAVAMWPRITNGCAALAKTELATSILNIQSLDFDQTTQEFAQFTLALPRNWNNGTVTARFYWTAAAGTAAQTVRWAISGGAYSNDDALTVALGTAQTVDDAFIAANDLHVTDYTSAITLAGSPADADFLAFQISRNVASDDLAADAKLLGVVITLTTDSGVAA